MEYEITFHDDYVEVRAWGRANLQGFIDYSREALERPQWNPGMNVFVDLSDIEGHDTDNISFDDSSRYAAFVVRNIERIGNIKTAIIPGRNFDSMVLVNMYETLTRYYGIKMNNRIVQNRTEALNWFRQE